MPKDDVMYEEYSEEQQDILKSIKQYWWILLLLFLWWLGRGRYGMQSIDQVDVWAFFFIMLYLAGERAVSEILQHSPIVISNPIATTFSGRIHPLGNYGAVRLGGMSYGITLEGMKGTLFFPMTAAISKGKHAVINTRNKPIKEEELPPSIRDDVIARGFPKPYYIGYADDDVLLDIPDLEFIFMEKQEQDKFINRLRGIAGLNREEIEHLMGFVNRIKEPSVGTKVRRLFVKKEGEE